MMCSNEVLHELTEDRCDCMSIVSNNMDSAFRMPSREVEEQRDLIQRLTAELRRYQMADQAAPPGERSADEQLPPWAANAVFLSPLLVSYDSRIQELETALVRARQDFEDLASNAKKLTSENLTLREELEKKWSDTIERERQQLEGGDLAYAFYQEEKNELHERLDLLSKENNLLLEQLDAFKTRNGYLEKLSVDRSKTAEHLLGELKQLTTDYNNLKVEAEELASHKEIAENKLKRVQENYGSLEREREESVTALNRLQNDFRIASQQVQYYTKAYEDLDRRKAEELELLQHELASTTAREKSAVNQAVLHERESEEAIEQANYYKREFESIRNECDAMLKIMEEYEQKIATFQQKEDATQQLARDSRQKAEEALLERDRAVLRESQQAKRVDRLQEQLRTDLAQQKTHYEGLVEAMRKKHQALVATREAEASAYLDRAATLQADVERLQRENTSAVADKQRAEEAVEAEQKRAARRLTEYEGQLRDQEELRLADKRALDRACQEHALDKQEWERTHSHFEHTNYELAKELEAAKTSSKRSADDALRAHTQAEALTRERDRLADELNALRYTMHERLEAAAAEYNAALGQLENELQEARAQQQLSEEKAFTLLKAQEKVSERWKLEHQQSVSYFEKVVHELNEEVKRLARRNRDLGDAVPIKVS